MEKKYNYTYQIKNLINGKTYIGVHSTDDLDDGYMGSGYRLKQSMRKHGKENFVKTIMCFFDTAEEMYEEEKFLVDEKWVKRKDTYNLTLGGNRPPINDRPHSEETKMKISKNNSMYRQENKDKLSKKLKGREIKQEWKDKISNTLKGNVDWMKNNKNGCGNKGKINKHIILDVSIGVYYNSMEISEILNCHPGNVIKALKKGKSVIKKIKTNFILCQ